MGAHDNYTLRKRCTRCRAPICDNTKGLYCKPCLGSGFVGRNGGYETRVDMAISPWRTIEHGVLMRTVEARA